MKNLLTIFGLLFVLSTNAQTIFPPAPSICLGDSQTFVAQVPGYNTDTLNFTWFINGSSFGSNNDTVNTGILNIGNYTITLQVTDSIGSTTQTIGTIAFGSLIVNPNPTATTGSNSPVCQGGTISLTASGGTSYSWTGPNGFISTQQNPTRPALGINAGTYTITVTNANGCTATDSTVVVVNSLPTPNISVSPNDTICQGSSVALFATGGGSYLWSNGKTTQSISETVLITGITTYGLTVTDGNGCSNTAFQQIFGNPNPTLTVGLTANTSCFGGSDGSAIFNASGGAPFTYLWNNGKTTQGITGLAVGTYAVTVTNVFGCINQAGFTVNEPSQLTDTISNTTNVSCNGGSDGSITVVATGGITPYNYSWSGAGSGSNPRANLSVGNYTVTVTDANGCTITASAVITQPNLLTANADSIPVSCFGGNGIVFVNPSGGMGPYSFLWSNNSTTSYVSGVIAGTYAVTVTDANGCVATSSTVVTQPNTLGLSAQLTNVSCNSGNNGNIDLTVSGGVTPYTYQWSNGFTGQDPQGLVAGTYSVTVTDNNGCISTSSWLIIQPSALVLTTNANPATCLANGSANASVSGGSVSYSYLWNTGATTSGISAPVGSYTVTVTDANGCQNQATAVIAAALPVGITGIKTDPTCFALSNGSVDITVTGVTPITYTWSNGATTEDITGVGASTYTVVATASNGCQSTASYTLVNPAPLSATITSTDVLCFGGNTGTATVTATGGTSPYFYSWSSGQNTSTATNLSAGGYGITVYDVNGCTTSNTVPVNQAAQLIATISSQVNITCANSNGSATVSIIGGLPNYSVVWSNGAMTQTITGLIAGSYTVVVTDANGCLATTTVVIQQMGSNSLYVNMSSQQSCGLSSGSIVAAVSGGQFPYTYGWSNGGSSPGISGLSAGSYSVTITDANGCQWIGGQTIQGSPAIVLNLVNQVLCQNNTVLVNLPFTGGTWPYQFLVVSPLGDTSTTPNINPTQQGVYQVSMTDAFGCTASGTMSVVLNPCGSNGIREIDGEAVKLFPNPTEKGGSVVITLPSNIYSAQLQVFDLVGKLIADQKITSQHLLSIPQEWAEGVYLLRIFCNDGVLTKRLIVTQ